MAYTKQYKRRTYKKKKPAWYNRKYTPAEVAYRAYRGVRYLKGLVNSEMHHLIVSGAGNVGTTATITHLTAIGQDDTASGRTGNSVLLRNIFMRVGFTNNASAVNTFCRFIIFQDNQQVGDTSPTTTDLLQSSSTLSSLSLNSSGRFKILKDYTFILDSIDKTSKFIKLYLNFRHHVRFNGTAGSDIQKGGIYMLALSDQGTNFPVIAYNVKLGWHDN